MIETLKTVGILALLITVGLAVYAIFLHRSNATEDGFKDEPLPSEPPLDSFLRDEERKLSEHIEAMGNPEFKELTSPKDVNKLPVINTEVKPSKKKYNKRANRV